MREKIDTNEIIYKTMLFSLQSTRGGASYSTQLSYGLPCKPGIPIEAILKTLFPFCGKQQNN